MLSVSYATRDFHTIVDKYLQTIQGCSKEILTYFTHKIRHTYGVLHVCQQIIALDPFLSSLEQEIQKKIEIACIFHDIGRFGQCRQDRILSRKERDHGLQGAKLLQETTRSAYPEILLAVKYHDKYDVNQMYADEVRKSLPENLQHQADILLKAVRDADKLQNMQYFVYKPVVLERHDDKTGGMIAEEIINQFNNRKQISYEDIHTLAEKYLNFASWIFDFNFVATKNILKNSPFLEIIQKQLASCGAKKEVLQKINREVR